MELTLLGTGAAAPTADRGVSGLYISSGPTNILLDCGEGTGRQIAALDLRLGIDAICVTHEHTDHIGGIVGLLRQMTLANRTDPLPIYSTAGSLARIRRVLDAYGEPLPFEIDWQVVTPGREWRIGSVAFKSFATEHRCDSTGFRIEEVPIKRRVNMDRIRELGIRPGPMLGQLQNMQTVTLPNGSTVSPEDVLMPPAPGATMAYTGDTRVTPSVLEGVKGVDVLVMDCTYLSADIKSACQHMHSTADEVSNLANDAGVGSVILTHISAKYDKEELGQFATEARANFSGDALLAQDGLRIEVKRALALAETTVAKQIGK